MASNVSLNDTYLDNIIDFTLAITSKGLEFTYGVLNELVSNWASTFAVLLIVGALFLILKKNLPNTNKMMPKLK